MPLPFILAGAAIISGIAGLVKGNDARKDFKKAERINDAAKELVEDAKSSIETVRDKTEKELTHLGKVKFNILANSLIPFVEDFKRIKNIKFNNISIGEDLPEIDENNLSKVIETTTEFSEIAYGGIASLGAGGVAGLAVYGSVGTFAAASTTTAIGTLSGAAATNATLAWLGGGSLATGGLGMAGGTAILGGIVAGPVLAIGGYMMANKAEAAVNDAWANRDQAELIAEELKEAESKTKAISMRINEIINVLEETDKTFKPLLSGLNNIVNTESLNQIKIKNDLAESIDTQILVVKENLSTYNGSTSGLWNKLIFIFKDNPNKKILEGSIESLTNISKEFGYSELINIPLSFNDIKLPNQHINDKLQNITSSITEVMTSKNEQDINYNLLSNENKKGLHMVINAAQTLKNILDVPLLDDEGNLTDDSENLVNQYEQKELLTA